MCVCVCTGQVIRLKVGEVLILPGGWLGADRKRHGMLYVLQRTDKGWKLVFVNYTDGLEYHRQSGKDAPKVCVCTYSVFTSVCSVFASIYPYVSSACHTLSTGEVRRHHGLRRHPL
jgi:hypothetical protein